MALKPKYLKKCTDEIEDEYEDMVTLILADIAGRLKSLDFTKKTKAFLQDKKEVVKAQQQWVAQKINETLAKAEKLATKLIDDSTKLSTEDTINRAKNAGIDVSELSDKPPVTSSKTEDESSEQKVNKNTVYDGSNFDNQKNSTKQIVKNELSNLTRTTAQLSKETLEQTFDRAYLDATSGAMTRDEAIAQAVQRLADMGLTKVEYPSGTKRSIEAAVRTAVRTAVNQNSLKCELEICNRLGANLVEVSAHLGARPTHAVWQGRVFWLNHQEGNYANFYEATGYGTATGLGGYNCRHAFFPYFEGQERTYEPLDETKNIEVYELEQQQRALERKIREWDRKQKILASGGQEQKSQSAKNRKLMYEDRLRKLVKKSEGLLVRNPGNEVGYINLANQKISTKKENVKINVQPKRLSDKVNLSEQNLNLNIEKQSKHILTGDLFKKHLEKTGKKYSYLTLDNTEIQQYINKYAGTGLKEYGISKGLVKWTKKEIIIANKEVIGYVVKEDGTEIATRYTKMHYSKTGVHVVPLDPKKGEKYEKMYTEGVEISKD